MRQVLRAGALGTPRGMGWGGRWERGSGWGTHVNPWLIHVNVWQNPVQYCKVVSLQLIKINGKKNNKMNQSKKKRLGVFTFSLPPSVSLSHLLHTHTHMHAYTRVYMCAHTYVHTHTHTHKAMLPKLRVADLDRW